LEAFSLANKPGPSLLDGIGNAAGYGIILVIVGFVREIFGSGSLWGFELFGDPKAKTGLYGLGYQDNGLMMLSPMALIVCGIIIWIQRSRTRQLIED